MADSDDWRVTISVSGQGQRPPALREAEEDIRRQAGRGIAVGAGDAQIFLRAAARSSRP